MNELNNEEQLVEECKAELRKILVDKYGGKIFLLGVGQVIQETGCGAFGIGKAIEALAEVEW